MAINVIKDYIKDKKQSKVVMPYTLDECVQSADGTKHLSLADIDNLKGDITHQAQRITNLENASKGILYDTVTDSTEAYVKSIQSGAVSGYGMLDYVGGKALVQSNQIVDVTVDKAIITGKNIFTIDNFVRVYDGTISFEGKNTVTLTSRYYASFNAYTQINTNYVFKCSGDTPKKIVITNASGTEIANSSTNTLTFNSGNNTEIVIYMYSAMGTSATKTFTNIQLEKGSSATAFAPYSTTEITLPTTTLKGINSSVYDIADFENGKVVRKVGSRAYQSGDESNPNYLTDMTTTYYPLATPTEETLTTDEIIIPIEPNGTITFNNAYGSSVPNSITYNIHTT